MFIQLFYTLYLIYIWKREKSKCLWKWYVYTIVLHIVFDIYGKESKANVYEKDMFIQLFYTLYLNRKEKNAK